MDFASRTNGEQFQRRLAETIAWCDLQDWSSHPAEKLRSPQSRPPEIIDSGHAIFEGQNPENCCVSGNWG